MKGETVSYANESPIESSGGRSGMYGKLTPEMFALADLNQQQVDEIVKTVPGGADNVQDIYPLSPSQEGMLFHHLLNQHSDTFRLSILFELQPDARSDSLVQAVQNLIDRHDILRTALVWEKLPRPMQVVRRKLHLHVEEFEARPDSTLVEQMTEEMNPQRRKFDLTRAPLLRLYLAGGPQDVKSYALLQIHHMVCDYQSWELVVREIMTCLRGQEYSLPAPTGYRSFVAQVLKRARTTDEEAFFRRKLGDVDEPTAPFGVLDAHGVGGKIEEARQTLEAGLVQQLRAQARYHTVSVARLLHAAWGLVVARTCGKDDVVFGTVVSVIRQPAARTYMMGMAINTVPLRLCLRDVTANELVEQTHRELAEVLNHTTTPLADVQRCSAVNGMAPLFTALLNFRRNVPTAETWEASAAGIRVHSRRGVMTNYPIALSVDDMEGGLALTVQTDPRISSRRVIGLLHTAIKSLVEALENAPQTPALALPVLPEEERRQVTASFTGARTEYPRDKVIHQLLEDQVHRAPDAVAVVYGGERLTYAQLNRRANRLAHILITHGVRPDDRVGLCVERSVAMVVGLFGILKAGGAYVPLDGRYPACRLAYMLRDSTPVVVVTQERLRGILPTNDLPVVTLDVDPDPGGETDSDLDPSRLGLTPRNLASVIYTSGSTGDPKGVMIEHAGLCNLAFMQRQAFDIGPEDRILQFASLSFDACTWECVMALCNGACLYVGSREELTPGEPLLRFLREHEITHATLPPVALGALPSSQSLPLSTLIVAGEACPVGLAQQWSVGRRFINAYGPTEATVCASMYEYEPHDTESVPIGWPIANAKIYILDSHGEPVPIGVTGELHVGGVGVARGYLGKPRLTSERFITDRFTSDGSARLYKTGDLGRWRENGSIEYLGRNDFQAKIRGFRIELGEIETQLVRHAQVREAVVVAHEDTNGEKRLVAYVTPHGEGRPTVEALREHLKALLPEYMVPSAFMLLEALPVTPNGKVDRRALPAPAIGEYAGANYEAPLGEVEQTLAKIWQELLQVGKVGRQDSFFELGGHSLLAVKSLFMIDQSFGCKLNVSDIYKHPLLRELAARIGGMVADDDDLVDLSREATLDDHIVSISASPQKVPAQHILLTGGTGFVGRFLLAQLLQETDATLYCLIRAQSAQHALSRLRTILLKWDLWREEFEHRIIAIPCDLGQPCLGIDTASYRMLGQTIDRIYHCATSMNHLETYAMSKPTNVGAAREILKLATQYKPKLVNYISSLSVFRSSAGDAFRVVDERSPIEGERHSASRGYIASKWVAERIFMTASDRGIPCNIFRVGLVWADTKLGRYDELQQGYRLFKSCLLSGFGIRNYQYQMPPTPVDHVARAIVFLADRHYEGRGIFHISSSSQPIEGLFERCNEIAGTSLHLLSYYEWISAIKRLHHEGRSLPVVPLIEFAFSMDEESFDAHQRGIRFQNIRFDCDRTQHELESAGIAAPMLNDELLRLYVERMYAEDRDLREWMEQRRSGDCGERIRGPRFDGLSLSGA